MIFDYRENTAKLAEIATRFDNLSVNLSVNQQLKCLDFIEQERENKKDFRFDDLILPVLQDFAELTASVLVVEKNNESQEVTATLKNTHGFDITRSCSYFRGLFVVADYTGIAIENNEIVLTLSFDY